MSSGLFFDRIYAKWQQSKSFERTIEYVKVDTVTSMEEINQKVGSDQFWTWHPFQSSSHLLDQ